MKERYDTFNSRFGAAFIDFLVFLPLTALGIYINKEATSVPILALYAVFSHSYYYLYSVLMHAKYGQTLGKMVTKVKILNSDETQIPGIKRALKRDSVYILISVATLIWFEYDLLTVGFNHAYHESQSILFFTVLSTVWVLSEFITMLTNKKRRAIHDFIGDTVVVHEPYLISEKD